MCCELPDVRGRHVVLGVTGGIAVYKSCEIVSRLRKLGVETHVIMTKNAAQFVQPLTFETLSNHPVVTDTFARPETWEVEHIALAKRADVFAIAPATANIMAKMACGIADDMLSTTVLATKAPILLAPAMNTGMWTAAVTQQNVQTLKARGVHFAGPEAGFLACGDTGAGRMSEPEAIVRAIVSLLCPKRDFAGLRVLVLEAEHPAAIRRQVSLCEAVYEGETAVEGLRAVRIETLAQEEEVWKQNAVPVLVDPQGKSIAPAKPDVLVDAILAKKNLGTTRDMAPLTIALGPGFTAGQDVDVVVETKRGHRLGRIIRDGSAIPDTGIPGIVGGYGKERVIHAGTAGIFMDLRKIGDIVEAGETIAQIRTADGAMISVTTQITGILRGLLRSSYPVTPGFKVADIDPRKEELSNCFLISDKARCIAGSVLELVCAQLWK